MKAIEEIKVTPVLNRSVKEEYLLAKAEKRQPLCVYCGLPLEVIRGRYIVLHWEWDSSTKEYFMDDDEDTEDPCCIHCKTADSDFIDEDLVSFD